MINSSKGAKERKEVKEILCDKEGIISCIIIYISFISAIKSIPNKPEKTS